MANTTVTKNALLSVYDKTGIVEFAQGLDKLGWTLYASGGTAQKIADAGVPVKDVSELIGGAAILGHRVVTLSREIFAGILADDSEEHASELASLNIPRIDLVCVDMYPLREAIAEPDSSETSVIEKTDIGGPTMLRAAAKSRRLVLSRADQRTTVLEWLTAGEPDAESFRKHLAATAELEVAQYVSESAEYLGNKEVAAWVGERQVVTKYGENPQQGNAGLFADRHNDDPLSLSKFNLVQGSAPSYNNYTDIDRLLQTVTHVAAVFERNTGKVPFIAIGVKHGNACGAAIGNSPTEAITRMLEGDERAIFGGSVLLNFALDETAANLLMKHHVEQGKRLLDVIVAADADAPALEALQRKEGKLRVLTNSMLDNLSEASLDATPRLRFVRGGMLVQDNYTFVLDHISPEVEHNGESSSDEISDDLLLAWAVGCTSNSNTITLVKDAQLIGNGVGQQDRVSAAELAIKRARDAKHDTTGAVAYSDSFFPFPDGPQVLADAGIKAILATRGSIQDANVLAAIRASSVEFYTVPDTFGRGFCQH